jgi:hypothetical protein
MPEPEPPVRAFLTDLRGLTFSEDDGAAESPVVIEVCRDGRWEHPELGTIEITPAVRESFVRNFQADVRRCGELPLDYDHEEGPAPGWIRRIYSEGSRLYAEVELTPAGRQRVRDREYRFFSPTWHPDYRDRESGKRFGPTLLGGALTNRPFIRGMAAVCCAETPPPNPGAQPQEGDPMPDTPESPAVALAERERLREQLTALEADNAVLRAAETRRAVLTELETLRFTERRRILAPASRTKLADLAVRLGESDRRTLMEALKDLQLAETGERGFTPAGDDPAEITASERDLLAEMARAHGLPVEALERNYRQARERRAGVGR